MNVRIDESWRKRLQEEFDKPYFEQLVTFVKNEYINPAKRKANARKNEKRFSQQKRKVLLKLEVLPLFKAKAKRHSNGD